ncbi:hypothetical protein like AT1G21280 [Hibiscus trionum]|uniref:Retrotransposon Copia-like N-terminal domain-containing protein n=1 Tax=Hibiscus trionum TaxID=183268 RepID=A0A9W7GUV1_HIBTR|nr:hypothetical protein like AT1G21280 [Hibiscus trionum]
MASSSSSSKPFTNKTITIRLDESNFLLWKQQILFAVESLGLISHIDGTISIPPHVVDDEKGIKVPNPDYLFYKQEDSALCSWLLASISPSILSSLVGCKTAVDIWKKVQQAYSTSSTTKLMHLHCSLRNIRKRDQSMKEYLGQI